MVAREYLQEIERLKKIIANKELEKQNWIELASGISVNMDRERVQASSDCHSMERQVVEAVQIDECIKALKAEIRERIETIEKLDASDYDFLHKVYVQGKSLKEVRNEMKKSYSWAKTKHSRAIKNLQKILDEKADKV